VAEPLDAKIDDALAVLAAHQVEGVVAKHLTSRWQPGRRSPYWRKHKLRRHELRVAAWHPGDGRRPEALYLRHSDGSPAGQVSIGIAAAGGDAQRDALATRVTATRRRAPALRIAPGLVVMVDAHGADGQALRDPILREWRITNPYLYAAAAASRLQPAGIASFVRAVLVHGRWVLDRS